MSEQTILHQHAPPLGGIDVKVSRTTTGVSAEIDVTRPRQEGETFEAAAEASAALARLAYERVVAEFAAIGTVFGKEGKTA